MKTLAAILYKLNSPLALEEVEIPPLKTGQLLVKILYSGICRAQLNEIIGLKGPDRYLPHMLGHEASAVVQETGAGVTKVRKGDYVILSWIKGVGLDGFCTQYKKGNRRINAGAVTTFSEYSVVSENRVTKISRKIPPDVAAIVGCAVATGMGILHNTLPVKPGDSVVVFGVGGVGTSVIMAAKKIGCSKIIAVDISRRKLQLAKRFGAIHLIKANGSALARLRRIEPQGLDYAVDASGVKSAMEMAFETIKPKGVCVIAGNLSKNEKIELHPFELIKGKKILGTWGGETLPDRDFPLYVRAYLKGELPLDRLITHCFKLKEINRAFDVLRKGEAGRIVLEMG